jgi:hypothetical protein
MGLGAASVTIRISSGSRHSSQDPVPPGSSRIESVQPVDAVIWRMAATTDLLQILEASLPRLELVWGQRFVSSVETGENWLS